MIKSIIFYYFIIINIFSFNIKNLNIKSFNYKINNYIKYFFHIFDLIINSFIYNL